MKKMRKLLPAIAMLLLSAVLMSTASFAWFSTNTTAKADNVSVTVSAANTLLIKKAESADYTTYINLNKTIVNMAPTSTATSVEPKFWKVASAGNEGDTIAPGSPAYTTSTTFEAAVVNEDYYYQSFNVRATGDDKDSGTLGTLKLSFTTTPASGVTNVSASLRVMFVVTDVANSDTKAVYVYSPFGDTEWVCVKDYASNAVVTEDSAECSAQAGTTILNSVVPEAEYVVDMYVWYEGQDSACYANNATEINPISVAIQLDLIAPVSGS